MFGNCACQVCRAPRRMGPTTRGCGMSTGHQVVWFFCLSGFYPSVSSISYIYKIVSADNPVRIDQICESEIKRVLLGTPFSPPTHVRVCAPKEWGPSGVLIAPKNSHSTSTMLRFPESCFFAFFRLFGSRKARAPEGKNGTKRHKH